MSYVVKPEVLKIAKGLISGKVYMKRELELLGRDSFSALLDILSVSNKILVNDREEYTVIEDDGEIGYY